MAERRICRAILKGETTTAADTQRTLFPDISSRTIGRVLDRNGLFARQPRCKPLLSKSAKKKRFAWAQDHKDWDEKWKNVVFSDESKFNLIGSDGIRWVRRRNGEALKDCHVKKRVQGGGGSVMVWGCITATGFGRLHQVEGRLNAKSYIELLSESLPPTFSDFKLNKRTTLFQQDNAPCHAAKLTKTFFNSRKIKTLPWPANSLDMNIIEHVWNMLDIRLGQRSRKPTNKDQLWAALQEEWEKLGQEYLDKLYESMPRRIQALYEARGGYTKY
jgi:hypothetical protein